MIEAHRFAARHLMSANTLRSKLDELSGIGPRRRKLLIQTFGSADGVRAASLEDLQGALGASVGRSIFDQLHAPHAPETPPDAPDPVAAPVEPGS